MLVFYLTFARSGFLFVDLDSNFVIQSIIMIVILRHAILKHSNKFYVISGHASGLVTCLEKRLGRNLHTIGCSLHQNELPLRAIFKEMDGTTSGPKEFSGPIGSLFPLPSIY